MTRIGTALLVGLLATAANAQAPIAVPGSGNSATITNNNREQNAGYNRVVGTLDIEQAIQKGERHFEPGVLASANRGLLYIDEVNLLDDHVVDLLLDAAAMGTNIVEREGVAVLHPAEDERVVGAGGDRETQHAPASIQAITASASKSSRSRSSTSSIVRPSRSRSADACAIRER